MVWCGVVWCGVLFCCVVWCGVVWCGLVHHNIRLWTQEDGILKNKLNTYFRLSYINNIDSNNNDIKPTSVLQNIEPSSNEVIVKKVQH